MKTELKGFEVEGHEVKKKRGWFGRQWDEFVIVQKTQWNPPHPNDWQIEHWAMMTACVVSCWPLGIWYVNKALHSEKKEADCNSNESK